MQSFSFKRKGNLLRFNAIFNYSAAMGIVLLLGVFIGSIIIKNIDLTQKNYLAYLVQNFLNIHKTSSFAGVLSFSFLSSLLIQFFLLLLAFCCFGAPFIVVMPLIKGVFIGCISAYLYSAMGVKGAFLNVIMLWIPQAIQAILLIIFAAVALDTSVSLFINNFIGQKQGTQAKFKRAVKLFIFTAFILLLSAALEGSLSGIFAPVLMK